MSFVQRLLKTLFPQGLAGDIEAESRAWMMQCTSCGSEMSVWDAGGIRYGAAGKPKRWLRCSKCGQRTWHQVYRKTEEKPQGSVTN